MTLEDLISARKEQIVRRFVLGAATLPGTPAVSRSQLTDSVPWFLDELLHALHRLMRDTRPSAHEERPAREHGKQRFALGFDLEALVSEYGILREAIIEVASIDQLQLTNAEFSCLCDALEVGVKEAVREYVAHANAAALTPETA